MQQWLTQINTREITTEIDKKNDIYFYHLKKGELENYKVPGHINYTYQLNTNFQKRLFNLCKKSIHWSGINDPLYDSSSLIICTQGNINELILLPKKEILERIKGFCLCHIDNLNTYTKNNNNAKNTPILYIELLCSSCKQGKNILDAIEKLSKQQKIDFFGKDYNTIGLTSVPEAIKFYQNKCKYERLNNDIMPFMYKVL